MSKTSDNYSYAASRRDSLQSRITGQQLFINDLQFPGMLYGCFHRSPLARARIVDINCAEASALPGVVRIFTGDDFSRNGVPRFGPLVTDQPVLANGSIKYMGEPIALVVAETIHIARNAASRINVTYDELPAIITFTAALSNDLIHEPTQRPLEQSRWAETNFMGIWNFGWGNFEQAERQSDFVIETTYKAPFVHHFAMEPHGAIGISDDGQVSVYSSIQHPFVARQVVAKMLGLDPSQVRIISVNMGGSFGAKGYPKLEPAVALFSMMLNQPLKIVASGDEEFFLAQREASKIHIRTGFSSIGDIMFQDIEADFLIGAYTDISPRVIAKAGFHAAGPYRTQATRIQTRGIFSNTAPTTAFRGFGSPHIAMALEGQINQAADRLNRDPLSLRKQNVRARGEVMVPGESCVDGDWDELLTKAADGLGWDQPKSSGHGRGIAMGMKSCVPGTISKARIRMRNSGEVQVEIGTTEMGQGTIQSFTLLVNKELGVSTDQITVVTGDTSLVPFDTITASSRSIVHMGNALLAACEDVRRQLIAIAKEYYGNARSNFAFRDGRFYWLKGDISIKDLLSKRLAFNSLEIIGEGRFDSEQNDSHPLGGPAPFYEAVVTAVELHIDNETGNVYVDRLVHVTDAGKVINPIRAVGLDDGGNIMGIGLALSEQLFYDHSGHLLNGCSLDYRIPTIEDIPRELISLFVENSDGPGPGGSKGIGEGGILAVVPAITGAILDCAGVLITEIPVTPESLWRALQQYKRS